MEDRMVDVSPEGEVNKVAMDEEERRRGAAKRMNKIRSGRR